MNFSLHSLIPENLSENQIAQLVPVTRRGFGIHMSQQDITQHITNCDHLVLVRDLSGSLRGFCSLIEANLPSQKRMAYIYGTVVDAAMQGIGVQKTINHLYLSQYDVILFRTQNNHLIKSLGPLAGKTYLGNIAVEKVRELLSGKILQRTGLAEIMRQNGVCQGLYGGPNGSEKSVEFIGENIYPGFSSTRGDSLLVAHIRS